MFGAQSPAWSRSLKRPGVGFSPSFFFSFFLSFFSSLPLSPPCFCFFHAPTRSQLSPLRLPDSTPCAPPPADLHLSHASRPLPIAACSRPSRGRRLPMLPHPLLLLSRASSSSRRLRPGCRRARPPLATSPSPRPLRPCPSSAAFASIPTPRSRAIPHPSSSSSASRPCRAFASCDACSPTNRHLLVTSSYDVPCCCCFLAVRVRSRLRACAASPCSFPMPRC